MRNPVLKTLIIIVLIFVLFPLGNAHGLYFYDGNGLLADMREFEKRERGLDYKEHKSIAFMGYVSGVFDATRLLYNAPSNTTVGQISAIVVKYLNEHPEKLSQVASDLVIEALKQAFPKRR